jgi:alpha-beta hydrolase superfamily lysophospholipase
VNQRFEKILRPPFGEQVSRSTLWVSPLSQVSTSQELNNMEIKEWSWRSSDGLAMYGRQWDPGLPPRAALVLVHGLGEHSTRYDHVAAALAEKGYAMLGFDLRGHGKSAGPRGHTPSYDALMDDISAFTRQVKSRYPGVPLFLYGHSLGGNLVLNYGLRCPSDFRGVIATGPWLELSFQPPASQVRLGRLMNRISPSFAQNSHLNTRGLSHDQAVVTAYEQDPLVHEKISARLFVSLYETGLWALEHAAEFPLPLLLMHGSLDPITSPKASQEFAKRAGDKVTLKIWNDLFHEIHNEPAQIEVFQFMSDWLDRQLMA